MPLPISIPTNYAGLALLTYKTSTFYLQIPLARINSFCLKPLKYLLFLGWCILGVEGDLAVQSGGEGVDPDGQLNDQDIYYCVSNTGVFLYGCPMHRALMVLYLFNKISCRLLTLR